MSLEQQLDADLKEAMRSGDEVRKLAIRSVKAAIAEAKVSGAEVRTLTDDDVQAILARQVKQRRDSMAEFARGGRPDLVAREEAEVTVLQTYLPAQMDEAAVREHARAVVAELGVTDMKGFGQVMKRMTTELRGRADGQLINRVVRDLLAEPSPGEGR